MTDLSRCLLDFGPIWGRSQIRSYSVQIVSGAEIEEFLTRCAKVGLAGFWLLKSEDIGLKSSMGRKGLIYKTKVQ